MEVKVAERKGNYFEKGGKHYSLFPSELILVVILTLHSTFIYTTTSATPHQLLRLINQPNFFPRLFPAIQQG